jgi:hypothetical protein
LDKLGTDRPASRRSESAWEDLREVAKVGLGDPGLLTKCKYLLELPAVQNSATDDDALSLAYALTERLRMLLNHLRWGASPKRKKIIDCLFMLDPSWAGTAITRRREYLAEVGYEGDTSRFRRDIERPLLEDIASLLGELKAKRKEKASETGSEPLPSIPWVQPRREPQAALERLANTLEYAVRQFVVDDERRGVPSLWCYANLLVRFNELKRQKEAGFILLEVFGETNRQTLDFQGALDGWEEDLLDFNAYDLALLRHTCIAVHPEALAFPFVLEASKRGQTIQEKWDKWSDSCICSKGNVAPECGFHKLAILWNTFGLSLSRSYDVNFAPLDLKATLG